MSARSDLALFRMEAPVGSRLFIGVEITDGYFDPNVVIRRLLRATDVDVWIGTQTVSKNATAVPRQL